MAKKPPKPPTNIEAELAQAVEQLRQHCRRRGMRFTQERVDVLRAVIEADGHFDPEEMLVFARTRGIRASRATLYRTLALLEDAGIIQQVLPGHRHRHYEYVFGRPAHDHIVNLATGEVVEFESDAVSRLGDDICRQRGLRAVRHRLLIYAEPQPAKPSGPEAKKTR